MTDLKNKIEALLFSSGRKMHIEEIAKLCRTNIDIAKNVLDELKKDYGEKKSSLMLVDEGHFWKLTTREDYLQLVRKIVTQTELSKTLMETLAVIAFKYPIKQADLIKMRTNKAYDHLRELEESGYITRQKYGRTKLIKLSQKFFDYFNLPEEKLKETFDDFQELAKVIEEKEKEVDEIKKEQKRMAEEAGRKDEEIKEAVDEVDLVDDNGKKVKLDVVEEEDENPKVEEYKEKLGDLEVVDEPEEEQKKEEKEENGEQEKQEEEPAEVKDDTGVEPEVKERMEQIDAAPDEVDPEVAKKVESLFSAGEKSEVDHEEKERLREQVSESLGVEGKSDDGEKKFEAMYTSGGEESEDKKKDKPEDKDAAS